MDSNRPGVTGFPSPVSLKPIRPFQHHEAGGEAGGSCSPMDKFYGGGVAVECCESRT